MYSSQDYYPFGMQMPSRHLYAYPNYYRFGYNGQMKEEHLTPDGPHGIHNTAMFWEYDTRLARRWNVDPRPVSGMSPYASFSNNPIIFSDPLGDTVRIEGSRSFVKQTERSLQKMRKTEEGASIYDALNNSTNVYTIRKHTANVTKVDQNSNLPANWQVGDIGITGGRFSKGFDFGKGGWVALAHEMSHALDVENGAVSNATWQTPDMTFSFTQVVQNANGSFSNGSQITQPVSPILVDEVRAVDRENKIRAQSGMSLRTHYNTVIINSATVPTGNPYSIKMPTQRLVDNNGIGTHPQYKTNYNLLRK